MGPKSQGSSQKPPALLDLPTHRGQNQKSPFEGDRILRHLSSQESGPWHTHSASAGQPDRSLGPTVKGINRQIKPPTTRTHNRVGIWNHDSSKPRVLSPGSEQKCQERHILAGTEEIKHVVSYLWEPGGRVRGQPLRAESSPQLAAGRRTGASSNKSKE